MTKKTKISRVGPVISAISSRAGQPMPLRPLPLGRLRSSRVVGGGAATAPPPTVVTLLDMMRGSLGPLGGVLDRVDDVLGTALAGQQVHHGGVERVADVLPVDRVEPLGDERRLVV